MSMHGIKPVQWGFNSRHTHQSYWRVYDKMVFLVPFWDFGISYDVQSVIEDANTWPLELIRRIRPTENPNTASVVVYKRSPVGRVMNFSTQSGSQRFSWGTPPQIQFGTGSFSALVICENIAEGMPFGHNNSTTDPGWKFNFDNGRARFIVTDGTNTASALTTATGEFVAGEFHSFLGTFDGVTKTARLYIDGILRDTTTNASVGSVTDTGEPISVGRLSAQGRFSGNLSVVAAFKDQLSQADSRLFTTFEFLQHERVRRGREPGRVAYIWR